MSYLAVIEGKIIRILSENKLIINVGLEHGVRPGMVFTVYGEEGETIIDPTTGEDLGVLEFPKAKVVVDTVLPKFSIVTNRKKTVSPFAAPAITSFSGLFTEIEDILPIDHDDIEPIIVPKDITIKVGDYVKSINK